MKIRVLYVSLKVEGNLIIVAFVVKKKKKKKIEVAVYLTLHVDDRDKNGRLEKIILATNNIYFHISRYSNSARKYFTESYAIFMKYPGTLIPLV